MGNALQSRTQLLHLIGKTEGGTLSPIAGKQATVVIVGCSGSDWQGILGNGGMQDWQASVQQQRGWEQIRLRHGATSLGLGAEGG